MDWGVELGPVDAADFNWLKLKQPLPAPRTRWATKAEKFLIYKHMRKDYRSVLKFALLTGLRLGGLLPLKTDIDFQRRLIRYKKKSRVRETLGYFPVTPALHRMLVHSMNLGQGHDEVFAFVCSRSHKGHQKGKRYPITREGFKTEMQKVIKAAGITEWRNIHDLRHTAATDMLAATGDVMMVRDALGHSAVDQTEKYAHGQLERLRAAMALPRR